MSQITTAPSPPAPPPSPPPSPAARRLTLGRWRDPRLWVGLMLVAASVLVGARVLAAADDTVGVWAVARDTAAGTPLARDVLVVEQVRFTDVATAHSYLQADEAVPAGAVVNRDLAAGELLAQTAIGTSQATAFELPVVVDAGGAPEDLRTGDVVDVWVAPTPHSSTTSPATRSLTAVPVVSAARSAGPFGDAATRQVLLGLDQGAVDKLGSMLEQMANGSVVLVRHGSPR